MLVDRGDLLLGRRGFNLDDFLFRRFRGRHGAALATVGTLVAAGAGVEASWAGGVAEAEWVHVFAGETGAAASPNSVSVVAANSRFMIASSRTR